MERGIARHGKPATAALIAVMIGVAGCAKPRVAEVYPQVAEYEGREVAEVTFIAPEPFSPDSLASLTDTEATECALFGFLPFCFRGVGWGYRVGRLDMRTVGSDLNRLTALYRQAGYFGTEVIPEIDELDGGDDPIHVRFLVRRGDGIVLDSVVVQGTEGIADPDSLEAEIPLQAGELLDLAEFVESADLVGRVLRARGHAYAEVLRNFAVDTIRDRATVWLLAVPGPRVTVDSILVVGARELSRTDVLRQLTFRSGDLLRQRDLRAGQRNLYELDLVRFASVTIAADSLQLTPADSTTSTVRVSIDEAPEHIVEATAGYGSVDCVRVRAQWTDRSVLGGGRKLTATGSMSRIGLDGPGDVLGGTLCRQGEDDEIATGLDYRAALDFTQPYFLSPENQLTAAVYAERQSEPQLYQRTARGGRVNFSRRYAPRELITAGLSGEYRKMRATPALYCAAFVACGPDEIGRFFEGRFRNAVNASWVRDRRVPALNPTSGNVIRSSLVWSTPLLLSDYDFLRASIEGSLYRPLRQGWVLAGSARFGSFLTAATLGPDDFVPPEERFFAGGASSVRGYSRSDLGPGLYIYDIPRDSSVADLDPDTIRDASFIPTGGTSVSVLSLEARFPSPVLRDLIRLAVFVDAGTVGLEPIWDLASEWRVTPGAGVRITTPVGPIRVDLGYNPYPKPTAPLYTVDEQAGGALVRLTDEYSNPTGGWRDLERFTLHIAVGQAF